tara:strand:- start:613 stop:1647 length:1035 start_codon:yes stop_codon:yes gene_type:complete
MNKNLNELYNWLELNHINFLKNFDLSKKSWIKSGGLIKTIIKPRNLIEIKKLYSYFKEKKINHYIIGNISNTLIRDGEILTPFVNLGLINKIKKLRNKEGLHILVGAGVSIPVFSKFIMKQSYSGTEGLFGIPGSVGGGIYMNSSSYGDSLTKNIHKIICIDTNQDLKILKKKDINFAWRFSDFQKNKYLIVGAYFFFPSNQCKPKKIIEDKFYKLLELRRKSQESRFPNLGSLFATKNLYSDLRFISPSFFLLFIINKFLNFIFFKKFLKRYLPISRNFISKLYIKNLGIGKYKEFSLSDKTINCLINKGTVESFNGINLIKDFQKKTKYKVRLENVILDKIL